MWSVIRCSISSPTSGQVAGGGDESGSRTRYRLLETMRQYALEKLGESGEADVVRTRHRDHYTALAAVLDAPAGGDYEQRLEQAETRDRQPARRVRLEPGKLRCRAGAGAGVVAAAAVASAGPPPGRADLVRHRPGRPRHAPGRGGARGAGAGARRQGHTRPLGRRRREPDQAQQALAIAREIDDPALLIRALTACGYIAAYFDAEAAAAYLTEAIGLARHLGDRWRLSQILVAQVVAALAANDPIAARAAAEEGRDLADAIGDRFDARRCRWYLGVAQLYQGDLAGAVAQFAAVADEAEAAHDEIWRVDSLAGLGIGAGVPG